MITARYLFIHIHFYLLNTPNRHSVVIEATQGLSFVIYFLFFIFAFYDTRNWD